LTFENPTIAYQIEMKNVYPVFNGILTGFGGQLMGNIDECFYDIKDAYPGIQAIIEKLTKNDKSSKLKAMYRIA
jgi:hypothetical protein